MEKRQCSNLRHRTFLGRQQDHLAPGAYIRILRLPVHLTQSSFFVAGQLANISRFWHRHLLSDRFRFYAHSEKFTWFYLDFALIASEVVSLIEGGNTGNAQSLVAWDAPLNSSSSTLAHTFQNSVQRIQNLINLGDYEKAVDECNILLDIDPEQAVPNLLMVIATLKGRGADRYQTKTIQRLEQHLSKACADPRFYPTALMIWGLIKHDHYVLNALHQEKPTLHDISQSLKKVDVEDIDLDLVEQVKASRTAYGSLGMVRFFRG